MRGRQEGVSEIAYELGNGEQSQTLEIEVGLGRLVAGLYPEGNVDAGSKWKHDSVRRETK